jgi:hypothetical protein
MSPFGRSKVVVVGSRYTKSVVKLANDYYGNYIHGKRATHCDDIVYIIYILLA